MSITDQVIQKIQALPLEGQQRVLDFVESLKQPAEAEETKSNGEARPTIWQKLSKLGREMELLPTDLPEDLAKNHDHYLHGMPKRP